MTQRSQICFITHHHPKRHRLERTRPEALTRGFRVLRGLAPANRLARHPALRRAPAPLNRATISGAIGGALVAVCPLRAPVLASGAPKGRGFQRVTRSQAAEI